jgi:UDP-N-acetylglucosamine diphosphorylase / glucose-1-phosphate thymidylyltransferase / UDP-N-acetylgalactosamine diphosphorylase / glucosamine-1-phosphate N-acetyltransferase / galactosamine-1-phosphate N-acetyltransferase
MKNIKAIILAAGESSRFYPFSNYHKSLIKIMGKTILEHTLASIKKSGIEDVVIVVADLQDKNLIKDGKKMGLNIKYVLQKNPTGMGDALLSAEKEIESDFFLVAPYHIDFHKFKNLMLDMKKNDSDIVLLTKKIGNPLYLQRTGILKLDGEKVVEIVEKPVLGSEPSDLGVIAIYLLNKLFIENLRQTKKENYSFEKSIASFAEKADVRFALTTDENISLKYPWEILSLKDNLFKNIKKYTANTAEIAPSAQILGDVYIDEGAKIMENAIVKGPCYIGKNAYVGTNAILRNGVDLGENSGIGANMEFKNTLMMEKSKVHSGFIGDSVIGENCRIGAGFNTANVRLDRTSVKSMVKNEKIDSGLKSLGVMIGDDARIGIKCSSMPGIIVGRRVMIGPNTSIAKNISDDNKYYTKFQEIIEKNE